MDLFKLDNLTGIKHLFLTPKGTTRVPVLFIWEVPRGATSSNKTTNKCMETTPAVKELSTLHVALNWLFGSSPVITNRLVVLNDDRLAVLGCLLVCTLL